MRGSRVRRAAHWLANRPRFILAALALNIVALLAMVCFWLPTPYQMLLPGPVTDTNTLIEPSPQETEGAFYLTSIYSNPASVAEWLYAKADPEAGLIPREQARPQHLSKKEYRKLLDTMMDNSKMAARVVAFRAAGFEVDVDGEGALIRDVRADSPAKGILEVNDIVVVAGGRAVSTKDDLIAVIRAHRPGDRLPLEVRRGEATLSLTTTLGESPEQQGRALMGVVVVTYKVTYSFPRELKIQSEELGGPSAGLMFALALYNTLTPGDLTGGHRIAGTGALATDGRVRSVGGVPYKVRAAEKAGAAYFLVPEDNANEARRAARTVQVVPVASFDEALPFVQQLPPAGGEALAAPPGTIVTGQRPPPDSHPSLAPFSPGSRPESANGIISP